MLQKIFIFFLLFGAVVSFAKDLTTTSGKVYKNYAIMGAAPNGIRVFHDGGVAILPVSEFPPELKETVDKIAKKIPVARKAAAKQPVDSDSKTGVARKTAAKNDTKEGGFDSRAFQASIEVISKKAIDDALTLGVAETKADTFFFLLSVAGYFVKDDNGVLNEKANQEAFTAAVLNINSDLLEKAKPFSPEKGEKQIRAIVLVLLAASDSFIQQPGQFNKAAFNAAFKNIDIDMAKKAADFMKSRSDLALSYLLTASGRFVDEAGMFNASGFNNRFKLLTTNQFTGNEEEREKTFLNLMKP